MRANLAALAKMANDDPKAALLAAAGDLSKYEVFHNLILVATHLRGDKIGSIYIPQKAMEEDRFQGKMGLVLKCGPLAFKDDSVAKFGGVEVEVGDWVLYRPSDGIELFIKDHMGLANDGLACRLIEDSLIKGRVTDPSLIY